ncbi:MAG TPA: prolyl oligopeptidase family serine peptidase [Cellvibrionaceae bacterium]|nr:prolyl oligopeptidase family serine peptidase [Cellvibrionaceae bacterium]HMY39259.1 prolyl oligopeptidase family serine peptidase [Marinagarivorans sp.]
MKLVIFLTLALLSLNVLGRPTIQDFTRERDLRTTVLSPNGRYIASIVNKDQMRILVITDLQAPNNPIIGRLNQKITRPKFVSWANDERLLVTIDVPYDTASVERDAQKKKDFNIDDYFMFSRIVSFDLHAQNPVTLLNDDKNLRWNINLSSIHHFLPNDPNNILMNVIKDDVICLSKVNVYNGTSETVAKGTRFTVAFISDYDGNTRYRYDYKPIAKEVLIYESQPEGKWNLIDQFKIDEKIEDSERRQGDLMGIMGENLVYRKRNEQTGFLELVSFNSKTKKTEVVASLPNQDILYPISDLRSNKIIGYAADGDYIREKFFDANLQQQYDKLSKKIGDYNFAIDSYSKVTDTAIVRISGVDNPLSFALYDFKKDELKSLGDAYHNIATRNLSYSAVANYTARDGKMIHAYILLPNDYDKNKKYPLIVLPHGGPQARDRAEYSDLDQFLSTRGYIIIKPNFRGSTGLGKAFEESGYKQWGGAMQDDLEDAVNFMVKKGYADPKNVCIVGASYGGYAALMGAVKTPDLYKCSVSINGVTHLRDLIASDKKEVDDDALIEKYWHQRIGHPIKDAAMLDANSPALHADKIKAPILLVASTKDTRVPFAQSKAMASALEKNKRDFNFVKVKDADHNPLEDKKDMEMVFSELEQFLAKHLQAASPK